MHRTARSRLIPIPRSPLLLTLSAHWRPGRLFFHVPTKFVRVASGILPVVFVVLGLGDSAAVAAGSESVRAPLPPPEVIAELPPDGGEAYNRLIFEKSPYLLQHARNPIDWYPWGEAAFERARELDRPIFLSVGYSTCHWCHVMERESFEDEEVAALLNEHFVAIKVDREERPDLDKVYMDVTRAMTGHGGWPMTVVMGPDRVPFFAATYIPKEGRLGRPGLMQLLPAIAKTWAADREQVEATAEQVEAFLRREQAAEAGQGLGRETLDQAYSELAERYDKEHGGFGRAPKFPQPHDFIFLSRYAERTGDERARTMTMETLRAMRRGGLFDHVGYGFHRYSTDREWLLPHFEKMLYDQAMMTLAYTEAYEATGEAEFAKTAREVLTYVLRGMTSPEGGFYSAEDADSEGEEGLFYTWTPEQVREALPEADAERWMRVFGFEEGGNYIDEADRRKTGRNIPHRDRSNEAWAEALGMEPGAFETWLETTREKLFAAREQRVHPLKDDKILTGWNGLMIAAMAKAARTLDEPVYEAAAVEAADFVLERLRDEDGRLLRRYRQGEAGLTAHLDDHAYLVWGLIELYETTFNPAYLTAALDLNEPMIKVFGAEGGEFYFAAEGSEDLIVRPLELSDGAKPSANSVAALNLLRLARMTGRTEYEERVDRMFETISGKVAAVPSGYTFLITAVDFAVGPSFEIVIAGEPGAEDTTAMLDALRSRYVPRAVVLFRPPAPGAPISELAPFTASQRPIDGRATAYVCENFTCEAPTTDAAAMLNHLKTPQLERTGP